MTRPPVTDRAVVEYLAQVWGVDVAGLRSRIAREAQAGLSGAGLGRAVGGRAGAGRGGGQPGPRQVRDPRRDGGGGGAPRRAADA